MGIVDEIIATGEVILTAPITVGTGLVNTVLDTALGEEGLLGSGGLGSVLSGPAIANGGGGGLTEAGLPTTLLRTVLAPVLGGLGGGVGGGVLSGLLSSILGGASDDDLMRSLAQLAAAHGGEPTLFTKVVAIYPDGTEIVRDLQRGTPKLMSRDFQIAKKVFNTVRKLNAKLPKKTVKESDNARLDRTIKQEALRRIEGGDPCCDSK